MWTSYLGLWINTFNTMYIKCYINNTLKYVSTNITYFFIFFNGFGLFNNNHNNFFSQFRFKSILK